MKAILLLFLVVIGLSCSKKNNDKPATTPCGTAVIINTLKYSNTAINNYNISAAVIEGDCLKISFGSGGCSGNTWVMELVDADAVFDSNPPQRQIKLALTNHELCNAAFSKTVSFDISGLKVWGSNSVILKLAGFNGSLVYHY
jgi:hypothetical protein